MNVSIVIPAYNEEAIIGQTVARIHSLYPDFETIIVDDGSTDNTALKAREAGAKVFQHPYNIGNGAAVKTGIRKASGDLVVLMDGDGQHDPAVRPH
jgi:glycosyltransferase involved in cell wall biosynthesis